MPTLEIRERDEGRSTVSGIVVPYGTVLRGPDGRMVRFAPGVFSSAVRRPGRVRVLWGENRTAGRSTGPRVVGTLAKVTETARGLEVAANIAATVGGLEASELIRSGALSDLSPRFDARESARVGGVLEYRSAQLLAVEIVPFAAYEIDAARYPNRAAIADVLDAIAARVAVRK